MDLQTNLQPESGKLEQIVSQFLLKSLHIILNSRIPSLSRHDRSGSRVRKTDKWFNLALGDRPRPTALDNLHFWHRNVMDPMIIDIILVYEGTGGSSIETVIERWVVHYEQSRGLAHDGDNSASYKKIYKKSIILLRALYSHMRFLPAYKIFRQLRTSGQTCNFEVIYKVSSFSDPFSSAGEEMIKEYSFTPVEALTGRLSVSVTYRSTLSEFNLECTPSMPPNIITDYVGSPNTEPMRSLPSSYKSVQVTSFPLGMPRPPSSVPVQRPHSWSSGFHQGAIAAQNQPFVGSPPTYPAVPMPYDIPSSPDSFSCQFQNHRVPIPHRTNCYEEYQLSPPFSQSQSPSSPSYFPNVGRAQTQSRSETAPVTIPNPWTNRNSRNLSPNFSDPNRHSLPPLSPMSPRSTKNEASSQESPSGIKSYRRIEVSRTGDIQHGLNTYAVQKSIKDNKDDSGRFSGLYSSSGSPRIGFSGSSSRLSFQDDLDDGDFSCPFDVDDVDTADFQASQNADSKDTSDCSSQSLAMGKKSQDAAVGVLVHMLKTAPPLRQDSSCYSSQSFKATKDEGGVATASGFFMPRKTADALEELRSYKEMRDLLVSKSGTRIISRDPS